MFSVLKANINVFFQICVRCIPFVSKLFTAIFNCDETAPLDLKPNTSMTVSVGNWTSLAPRWIVLQRVLLVS